MNGGNIFDKAGDYNKQQYIYNEVYSNRGVPKNSEVLDISIVETKDNQGNVIKTDTTITNK